MKIIKFENAFGISKLSFDKQVCFGDDNAVNYLIYAPNGTFKSSFAKTFYNWSNEQKVLDRINEIDFIGEVEIGGKKVIYPNKIDNVLVYSSDVNESSDYLGYIKQLIMSGLDRSLIQSQEEKIKNKKNEMLDILNKTDIKFDDYTSIAFPNSSFSTLEMLIKFYTGINSSCKVDGLEKIIDIRKIKQKAYSVLDEKKVKEHLKAYQDIIKSRLNSDFYDELFSETKGQDLLKILKDTDFLSKESKRGIIIDGTEYYNLSDLENLFKKKLNEILSDPTVIEKSEALQKNLGKAVLAKDFSEKIVQFPEISLNIPIGRENIIYSLLKNSFDYDYSETINELNIIKQELQKIYEKASKNKNLFDTIVEEYTEIFQPVFTIKVENTVECLSGNKVPDVVFSHQRDSDACRGMTKEKINEYLSSGEKSTLKILDFMFMYNNIKLNAGSEDKILIILDDIVETFDYRNRAGFLQYIHSLISDKRNELIILTHNYEFYERVYKAIDKERLISLVAYTKKNGKVYIEKNSKIHINMQNQFNHISNTNELISRIPFFRELQNYLGEGGKSNLLNNCLHYKNETKDIMVFDIKDYLIENGIVSTATISNDSKYLIELVKLASKITSGNYFNIIPKIILSIASRILIEKIAINDDFSKLEGIDNNQTRQILNLYSHENDSRTIQLLNKVLLLTPDFIHINSFMFEPLVDICPDDLIDLFNEIKDLHDNKFGSLYDE